MSLSSFVTNPYSFSSKAFPLCLSPPGNCQVFEDELFLKGRCLMSLSSSVTFKAAYDPNATAYASMRGKIGTTHFPGSTRVLDRRTMTMAPCSTTTCPLATDTVKDTVRGASRAAVRDRAACQLEPPCSVFMVT